jgi:hypothetical protein
MEPACDRTTQASGVERKGTIMPLADTAGNVRSRRNAEFNRSVDCLDTPASHYSAANNKRCDRKIQAEHPGFLPRPIVAASAPLPSAASSVFERGHHRRRCGRFRSG